MESVNWQVLHTLDLRKLDITLQFPDKPNLLAETPRKEQLWRFFFLPLENKKPTQTKYFWFIFVVSYSRHVKFCSSPLTSLQSKKGQRKRLTISSDRYQSEQREPQSHLAVSFVRGTRGEEGTNILNRSRHEIPSDFLIDAWYGI